MKTNKTRAELEAAITRLWVEEYKRDEKVLDLNKFNDEELEEGLIKLKSIRLGLEILMNDRGATALALHLLSNGLEKVDENERKRGANKE